MGPDSDQVRVPSEKVVPHLQVLDLLEVLLGVVSAVEESPVKRTQDSLPPLVLQPGQRQILLRDETA